MHARSSLAPVAAPSPGPAARVRSVDVVRGAVMVLMAIDHVRVYAGVPAGGPSPGVFFTRWVTHFCAPAFVFLAGASAYFHARRSGPDALPRWLLTRGAWLVLLELTVVRFFWTFNFGYDRLLLAGVLWMIGWCMIGMALLARLPVKAVGVLGLAIVAGHNLVSFAPAPSVKALLDGPVGWLWRILYFGGPVGDGPTLFVLYSFIPWIGVMAAGYAFAALVLGDAQRRRRLCFAIGLGATALFIVLRLLNVYGDRPWSSAGPMPAALAFLNTTKYPASLLFLLMTLGPAIALMPLVEDARGRWARWLEVFGRVPFFYYLLHIPLIHVMAVLISLVRTPDATGWLLQDHPVGPPPVPDGYMWSLTLLYAVTVLAVVILYPPCRWFAQVKQRRRDAWLGYL